MNKQEIQTNKISTESDTNVAADAHGFEDVQVAHYVVDLLNDHAQHLTALTAKRLSVARGLAVSQLSNQQALKQSGNVLAWFGVQLERHRIMSTAMLVGAILLAFYAVQQIGSNRNLEESDAFLLASDLPPEAYVDKGFDTWLVSKND